MRVEKIALHVPELEDAAKVLQKSLQETFKNVSVNVAECPDLTQEPFRIAGKGICGSPRIADIGGVAYIMPTAEMDKIYDLTRVPEWTDMKDNAFIIGAGGSSTSVHDNNLCEMVPNLHVDKSKKVTYSSRICYVNHDNDEYKLKEVNDSCACRHLANVFVSEGKPGKVIEIRASNRTGSDDFIKSIKSTLKQTYGDKPVVIGGVFLLLKGKANIHVMPRYSPTPLLCKEDVDNWLNFYDMSAPLVCTGYMVSTDPGYKLRMEHFHCYSSHRDGGHFHYDTTPSEAEYVAYFNIAESIYRVDRWDENHLDIDYAD